MRGKMYIIRRVIPLLTLCAILNGCNALRASETMDPLRGPDASPLSDPDIAATASIPTTEPLETFAASSSSSAIHASQTPMTTAARPDPTLTPSPTFTPSVVPGMPENCHPFPYDIEGFSQASNGEMLVNAICKGESIEFPSPVGAPVIYDYTPSTGRLAYSRNIERAYDPRTGYSHGAIGDLWVFDFWTGQDERWLDGGVWEIAWSPVKDPQIGKQYLAILLSDETIALGTGPYTFNPIANLDHVCYFSWSPIGNRIAYVKDCQALYDGLCDYAYAGTAYIAPIDGGQPRKMAEKVHDAPVWALDQQAIILPGTEIKIFHLEQSKTFVPTLPNGNSIEGACTQWFRWSPSNQMLVFVRLRRYDGDSAWIYEFSEDFQQVINYGKAGALFYSTERRPNGGIHIRPDRGGQIFMAKVLSINGTSMRVGIVIPEEGGNAYGSWSVTLTHQTIFLDAQANPTTIDEFAKEMFIELKAKTIAEDTFSLLATRLRVVEPIYGEATFQGTVMHSSLNNSWRYNYIDMEITHPAYESHDCSSIRIVVDEHTQIVNQRGDPLAPSVIVKDRSIEVTGRSDPAEPSNFLASIVKVLD